VTASELYFRQLKVTKFKARMCNLSAQLATLGEVEWYATVLYSILIPAYNMVQRSIFLQVIPQNLP